MKRSNNLEDNAELNILKRKFDSMKKENDLLRKQTHDFKIQIESLKQTATDKDNSQLDGTRNSYELKAVNIKRDQNTLRDLQLKELEVKYPH